MTKGYLAVSKKEMEEQGLKQFDFVYITGDAYVDHPSFGAAIISRILDANGYSVGIISQPDWKQEDSICIYGEPRLGFLVTAGNMDSMVNHYTVSKKHRSTDAYTPGGIMGRRPDYATIVYSNLIRRTYKKTPIIIGGIEASLRRMAHYDYWSNKVKRSILVDSGADLLLYGMGEKSILEVAEALNSGIPVNEITYVRGTVYRTSRMDLLEDGLFLPSYESILESKQVYAQSFIQQYRNTDPFVAHKLVEPYPNKQFIVQNPPSYPLTQMEMDDVYDLPYMRSYHPSYEAAGGVPAIKEVRFSLVSSRGCFGACSFCALTFHQGRIIQARSHDSIIKEAKACTQEADFCGYIHDVGGPTANFRHPACKKQVEKGACMDRQCLFPKVCPNVDADHSDYIKLLKELRELKGVKKVFVRSGIRFDYLLADKNKDFLRELCQYHVSGQLKVAPEHISNQVLEKMGKPPVEVYDRFREAYKRMNQKIGKDQYLVPYLMSSHPGSTLKEAIELAEYLRDLGISPEQVQDFYPTPSTLSTCMYYTGLDPRTMQEVYVPVNPHEKAMQRALVQYRNPANYELVKEALIKAGRRDLIGFGPMCLIRPEKGKSSHRDSERKMTPVKKAASYKQEEGSKDNHKKDSSKKKKRIRNIHRKK